MIKPWLLRPLPDNYTKLLLHCDGADGSAVFLDSSPIPKTVTAVGTAQIDTAQSKFGGASGLFDGDSDYLTLDDHADWTFGTGDFTIDFQIRWPSLGMNQVIVGQYVDATHRWFVMIDTVNKFVIHAQYAASPMFSRTLLSSLFLTKDTWYHCEFCRSGTTLYCFVEGISKGFDNNDGTGDMADLAASLRIGAYAGDARFFGGWLDEPRISKGIARHTANFTPPQYPY